MFAMFFVIWGHCFPQKMSAFIYAFNVPVFFILSGFLTSGLKKDKPFLKPFSKTLLTPYLLLAFLKAAGRIVKGFASGEWYITVTAIFCGFHSIGDVQGCSNLWFVYSLMIVRLVYVVVRGNKTILVALSIVSVVATVLLCSHFDMPKWAVSDALIALPFFTTGHLLRTVWKQGTDRFIEMLKKMSGLVKGLVFVCLCLAVFMIGQLNGTAGVYEADYGNNLLLLFVGSLLGAVMLLLPSVALDHKQFGFINTLAAGNIVTLTFHREILHTPLKMINNSDLSPWFQDGCTFLLSWAVLACFIPICWVIVNYVPVFVGGRGK